MKKTWYTFNKAESPDTPDTVTLMDDIGSWGVSAKDFLQEVRASTSKVMNLEINSPGGDVFAGLAMYNGLRSSGKTINVKVLGIAASAASVVAMAGDTIEMPENTFMMVHNPWTFAAGDSNDLREQADLLDKIGASLVATYAKRTGKPEDEIKALLDAETWFTAQEAVDAGFATAVLPASAVEASFDLDRLPEAARKAFAKASAPPEPVITPPDDTPPAPEEPDEGPTHAEQVQEVAAKYGMSAHAAAWALDSKLADIGAVKARAREAKEINALCVLAQKPDMAEVLIREGKTLNDARVAIFAALEGADEHIDTTPPAATPQASAVQPPAAGTKSIWAARHKQTGVIA